jgi:hypothetical protein
LRLFQSSSWWLHQRLPGADGTARPAEPRRLARKRNLRATAATKQPAGQITRKSVKPMREKYSDFPKSQISL